jgi:hypothetical protein
VNELLGETDFLLHPCGAQAAHASVSVAVISNQVASCNDGTKTIVCKAPTYSVRVIVVDPQAVRIHEKGGAQSALF